MASRPGSGDTVRSYGGEELFKALRDRILKGRYKSGKLPTIQELEEGTADNSTLKAKRHAIRLAYKMLLSEGLIETKGRGGTIISSRQSKEERTRLIGLVTTSIQFEFIAKVTEGILSRLQEVNGEGKQDQKYRLVIEWSQDDCRREGELLEELKTQADGIILLPVHSVEASGRAVKTFDAFKDQKFPLMLIGRDINEPAYTWMGPFLHYPEARAGAEVAAFVKRQKFHDRHIFILGEERNSALVNRANSIKIALSSEEIGAKTIEQHLIGEIREDAGLKLAQKLAHRFTPDEPSLAICTSDLVGASFLRGLREADKKVPDDVMVMAIDGDGLGALTNPTLTSLRLYPHSLGRAAIDAMISWITAGVFTSPDERILASTIGGVLEGESTGHGMRAWASRSRPGTVKAQESEEPD